MKIKVPDRITGYKAGAFLVGGSVRDLIRGRTPDDYDIAVCSDPLGFAEHIAEKEGGRVVVLGKKGFSVYRVASARGNIDITACKDNDIRQDLLARDFTINALACDLTDGRIIDVTGGLEDLNRGIVRMVSPAAFQEDPARLVRAFRMAATLHYRIDAPTLSAIAAHAGLLRDTAIERIWSELLKLLAGSPCGPHLESMAETGILEAIFPELSANPKAPRYLSKAMGSLPRAFRAVHTLECMLREPSKYLPRGPVQFIETLDSESRALQKLSLLMIDIGSPPGQRIDASGRARYCGHAARGASMVQSIGKRLHMSNRQIAFVAALVGKHQRPLLLFRSVQKYPSVTPRAVGRFLWQCNELAPHLLIQALACHIHREAPPASGLQGMDTFLIDMLAAYCNQMFESGFTPLLNGNDLIGRFGLQPSPFLGTLLRRVAELQLAGEIVSRTQALTWVAQHLKRYPARDNPTP